ncbi:hypothetical protein [Micromonospora avicenniae]|uniref:Uncharacterized protein n=1 Tax=Micromonospora avicenniae TaxID=1198245 RepID=A0A1N6X5G3_9ACTN|nr:hypothetical protein [Micromonospora avicenniae]SIQ97527.1 hypothetical protein SAMN05444858_105230 [Micromonospora avicenniae]
MTRGEFVLSAMIAGLLLVVAAGHEAAVEGPPAQVAASPAAFAGADPESSAEAGPQPEAAGPQPEAAAAPQPNPIVDVFVEVSPSTVQPGYLVGIKASCRDNSIPATVVSDAFGRVQAQPQHGVLTAAPMVRERTFPGNYRVKLECRDGQTASTMLQVVKSVTPSRGPATGFGGTAGGFRGGLLVPFGVALAVAGLVVALVTLRRPRTGRGSARG